MADRASSWYDRALPPPFAALVGLAIAPSFVLGSSLAVVVARLSALLLLAALAGVRLLPLRTGTFFALVVAFNLLSPAGRLLFTVLGVPITVDALTHGLERAATLTSFLLLSKLAIRPALALPGRFGGLITLTLTYLRELLALPVAEMVKHPTARLDQLLLQLHREGGDRSLRAAGPTVPPPRINAVALMVATSLVVGSWVAAFGS